MLLTQTQLTTVSISDCAPTRQLGIRGVGVTGLTAVQDPRGPLLAGEAGCGIPFAPARFFTVQGVPAGTVRGGHAHRSLHELLVCLSGTISVDVTDGHRKRTVILDTPTRGLHLEPMIWATQHSHSPDAVLLVLASLPYNPDDYIKTFEDYCTLVFAMDHF